MTFGLLNLVMLLGLGAVLIPPIIHLLNRRRYNVVDWGAMQFLDISEAKRRRLFLEEILLMLLRMGVLALLVLALAAPFVTGPWIAQFASRPPRDVLFVFDGSGSMTLDDGANPTPQVQAQKWAIAMLDELSPGDRVMVVQAREQILPLLTNPTSDFAKVREVIQTMPVPAGVCSGPDAIARALEMLQTHKENQQQDVIVLSDGHDVGWLDSDSKARWEKLAKQWQKESHPRLWFVNVLGDTKIPSPAPNIALGAIRASGQGWVGQPLRLQTTVLGSGFQKAVPVRLVVEVDGKRASTIDLADMIGGRQLPITVPQRFDSAESHRVSLIVEPKQDKDAAKFQDMLPSDNQRDWAINIRKSLPILIVDGDSKLSSESSSFFLDKALAPISESTPAIVKAKTIPYTALQAKMLLSDSANDVPRILVLADVPELTPALERAVDQYLDNGGSVWMIAGPRTKVEYYNGKSFRAGQGWLPGSLTTISNNPKKKDYTVSPDIHELLHPALTVFREETNCTLGNARFGQWWKVRPSANARTTNLALLTNGEPMLLEHSYKNGMVLISTVPFDASWDSTLPRVWEYPVLVHELLYHLAGQDLQPRNLTPGQPILFQPDKAHASRYKLPTEVQVQRPDGESDLIAIDEWPLRYDSTTLPGVYRIEFKGTAPEIYTVQADPRESSLNYAGEKLEDTMAGLAPFAFPANANEIGLAVVAPDHREDLWWLVMIAVILLLCGEIWLTRRMVAGQQ